MQGRQFDCAMVWALDANAVVTIRRKGLAGRLALPLLSYKAKDHTA